MANDGIPQVQAFRTRITKLNANGVPSNGANKSYVTNALVTLATTPNYMAGTDITEKNGEGVICVDFLGPDTFRRIDWTLTLCTPDPYLLEMLTGGAALTLGAAVGFAYPATGSVDPTNVSIELWTKRVSNGNLDDTYPYAHWVLPRCKHMKIGQTTFGNNAVLPQVMGLATENANWFDGPSITFPWRVASDKVLQYLPVGSNDVPAASASYVTVAAS